MWDSQSKTDPIPLTVQSTPTEKNPLVWSSQSIVFHKSHGFFLVPCCVYANLNLWLPMCLPRRMSTYLCSGGLWWAAFCWWNLPWMIFAGDPRGVTAPRPLWDFSREQPHSLPSLAICAELTQTDPLAEALRRLQSNHCNPLAPTEGEWRGFKHPRPNTAFTLHLTNQSVICT